MPKDFTIPLTLEEAVNKLPAEIFNKGIYSGELKDKYSIKTEEEKECIILLYNKSLGNESVTINVTLDNFCGYTRVHCATSGITEGIFSNPGEKLERIVVKALGGDLTQFTNDSNENLLIDISEKLENSAVEIKEKAEGFINTFSSKLDKKKKDKDFKKRGL
ncbi:DUF6054 family protein [Anaerovorax odorimutans]|uniref:DUF6054 family protein n=1 Tax=Anaerovorax odorimutans TaxID=109327 RepID=UPI000418DEFF|nr:DUF6054 family protein [Anaerovorax odorimutans]